MRSHYLNRYCTILRLNQLNSLAEELHSKVVETSDLIFMVREEEDAGTEACVQTASKCAAEARDILNSLEDQIRKMEPRLNGKKPIEQRQNG